MYCIGLLDGSYCIGWIVSYWLDYIVLSRLYLSDGSYQETLDFMRWFVTVWMVMTVLMDWMGRWWNGVG